MAQAVDLPFRQVTGGVRQVFLVTLLVVAVGAVTAVAVPAVQRHADERNLDPACARGDGRVVGRVVKVYDGSDED